MDENISSETFDKLMARIDTVSHQDFKRVPDDSALTRF
jgi:hypothetical protein